MMGDFFARLLVTTLVIAATFYVALLLGRYVEQIVGAELTTVLAGYGMVSVLAVLYVLIDYIFNGTGKKKAEEKTNG